MPDPPRSPRTPDRPARRSVVVFMALGAGYFFARDALPALPALSPTVLLSLAAIAVISAAFIRGWASRLALLLGVVLAGAGWFSLRVHHRPADSLARLAATAEPGRDTAPVLVAALGVVTSAPEPGGAPRGVLGPALARELHAPPTVRFSLRVVAVDTGRDRLPASGTLRVRVRTDEPGLANVAPGATVRVAGELSPIRPARNPGEPDWAALATQDGLVGTLDVPSPELVTPRPPDTLAERVSVAWHRFRGVLHARALGALGDPSAVDPAAPDRLAARALIAALLLGERDDRLRDVSAAFTRLGLLHMVAISGFNLAVMAGAAMFLLRLTGDRGPLEPLLVGLLVLAYLVVLPADAPILRAGILVLALLLTESLGRRYDRVTVLAWVGVVLLLVRPLDLFNLGFQLSFGVVAALLLLAEATDHRLFGAPVLGLVKPHRPPGPPRPADLLALGGNAAKAGMKANIAASVLAWLVSTPVVALHTGLVSPLAIISGLFVLPLTILLLWVGYAALLLGTAVPAAAGASGVVLEWLGVVLVRAVLLLDRLPLTAVYLPKLSPLWALGAVATVVFAVLAPRARRRQVWLAATLVVVTLGVQIAWPTARAAAGPPRVDVLAVGEGSCQLVRAGGAAVLVDAGSSASGLGERVIPQALRELGSWRVPTVIITRPTLDAFSALPELVTPLGVSTVRVPAALLTMADNAPQGPAGELLRHLESRGVAVHPLLDGETLALGDATLRIHAPPITPSTPADASAVLRVQAADGATILLLSAAPDSTIATIGPIDTLVGVVGRPRALASPAAARLLAAHPRASRICSGHSAAPGIVDTARHGWQTVQLSGPRADALHSPNP